MSIDTAKNINCRVEDLGLIDYLTAYQYQQECVEKVRQKGRGFLILCEHPAVLTLGRMTKKDNLLKPANEILDQGVNIHNIDRGGDVTLHSPGQLVIYPIFDLTLYGKDLHAFLHKLEQLAIDLLNDFDIVATRFSGRTGVWVGNRKIVSMGIGVRKWISYHGLAINVNTDLKFFNLIRPCGLEVQMTSMAEIKNKFIPINSVKERMIEHFCKNFNLTKELS